MTEHDPLDPEILASLRSAMPMAEVPDDARARIRARVDAGIVALAAGAAALSTTSPAGPAASALRAPTTSWIAAHPWVALTAAFALGGVAGSTFTRSTPTERVVYVDRTAEEAPRSPSTAPAPSVGTLPSPVVPVEALPRASAGPKPSGSPATPEADPGERLAAESAILDVARAAIAAGEGDKALDAVRRHERAFPRGILAEEREALAIRADIVAGRRDDAQARATRFRARYPESLFLPALDAALRATP